MEVKMKPIALDAIPGMKMKRDHDEWAARAIEEFAKSGQDAAELTVPKFDVGEQTVIAALRQRGIARGVKVRCVNSRAAKGTYLIRKEALDAKR